MNTITRWRTNSEYSFLLQLLLLLMLAVLLNSFINDRSLSAAAAYSPTTPPTVRREFFFRKARLRPMFSSILSSSKNDNYSVGSIGIGSPSSTSDDRRNESLEQGNHPLWSLNLNLDSLAQAGAGSRAQELLKRIQALYTEGYYDVSPDIVSYNSVLKAWKEDEQPQAALDLLETMIHNERQAAEEKEQLLEPNDKNIRVDVISFNTVIAAFANQGNYRKALEILRKMEKTSASKSIRSDSQFDSDSDSDHGFEFDDYFYPDPDTITYNIVLYSLAQSEDLGAAAQAENLLREMMMRKECTGISVVDTTSFNTVLYAWSREGGKKANQSSVDTSTTTLDVKSKRIPTKKRKVSTEMTAMRAQDLLTIMEELSEAGNLNVRPDVYSYTTTIQCWAKCQSFADKAQDILNRMIERDLQPNKLTYTALMNALSKSGNPEKAEYVLHQMIRSHQQPDTVAFSSIIDGWAKISSKDRPEAAARALQILETMKGNASQGMGPSATTYTSVLNALAKSGLREACDQALDLLQDMEEEYSVMMGGSDESSSTLQDSNLDPRRDKWSIRPTNIHYNCVLNAYARSSRADKAIRAQKLMTVMENHSRLDCRPDTISYK